MYLIHTRCIKIINIVIFHLEKNKIVTQLIQNVKENK